MLLDALTLLCLLMLSMWILYVPSPASLNLLIVVSLSTAAGAIALTLLPKVRTKRLPLLMNLVTGCLYATLLALMIVAGSKAALGASVSRSVLMLGALTSAVMASRQVFMLFDKRHAERVTFASEVVAFDSPVAAVHDKVTALPLRSALTDRLNSLTNSPAMSRLALLILDLDDFTAFNTEHGQRIGDAALLKVADTMRGIARSGDLVVRFGADEFAVLFEGVDNGTLATETATRFDLPACVGIAHASTTDGSIGDLIRQAEQALVAAKRQGARRWALYAPVLETISK